jgi:hypothetical protein
MHLRFYGYGFKLIFIFLIDLFKLKFEKATKGQVFEGLDLLTKLLTPISNKIDANPARNLIEEIPSVNDNNLIEQENNSEDDEDEDEIEWFLEQNFNESQNNMGDLSSNIKYGFSNGKSNVFSKLSVNFIYFTENILNF